MSNSNKKDDALKKMLVMCQELNSHIPKIVEALEVSTKIQAEEAAKKKLSLHRDAANLDQLRVEFLAQSPEALEGLWLSMYAEKFSRAIKIVERVVKEEKL